MNDDIKQPQHEQAASEIAPQSRRDFLIRAGLMAGTVLCLSEEYATATAAGDDTKITKLGLNEQEIKILTLRARDLSKKDLDSLSTLTRGKPKDKEEVLKKFNSYLKAEGKQGIIVTDLDSLTKATQRVNANKRYVDQGRVVVACCCCCCSEK